MSETEKEPIEVNELSKKIYHHMSGIDKNEFNNFVRELVEIGVFTENSSEKLKSFVSDKDKEEEMTSLVYDCLGNIKILLAKNINKDEKDKWDYIPINLVVDNECKSIVKFLNDEKILDDPDKKFIKTNFRNNETTNIEEYIDIITRTLLNNDNLKLEPDDEEGLIIFKLQCGGKGSTTLYSAINNNQTRVVDHLIKNKMCEEEEKKKALFIAFNEGLVDISNFLLDNLIKTRNEVGKELLCQAAEKGKFNLLIKLINKYKVDPNTKFDNNKTILHIAAENGQKNIVKYLASNYKNLILEKTTDGKTALQLAYERFGVCKLTGFLNNETENALKSNVRKMAKDRNFLETNIHKINFINSSNKSVVDSIRLICKPNVLVPYFPIKINNQDGFISDHIIYSSKCGNMNLEESIKHNILLTNLENVLKNCKDKMTITESGNILHNCSETERYKKRLSDFTKIDSKITIAGITYGVAITLGKIKNTTNDYELYEMVIKNNFDGKGGYRLRY